MNNLRFFAGPVTDVQRSTSSNGNETGIAGAQSELTDYYTNKSVLFPGPTSNVDDCISPETASQGKMTVSFSK